MATFAWQTWNSAPFSIERKRGKTPGTVIICVSGPLTVRDVYTALSPMELNKVIDSPAEPGEEPLVKIVLDLSACPSMDSSGLGILATHYVRCRRNGIKMIAVGASPRVREVLKITKMDSVIPMVATQYVRCQRNGIKMIAVGASPRVLEVLKITKMDSVIPMAATMEEAESA